MCGSLVAGMLWEGVGASWVFTFAAGVSVVALIIAWVWVARQQKKVLPSEDDFNVV
jgi:predicted MFS family arabinose efflux permease